MNGFTNSILSILLGWLRLLIGQIWAALNSESGSRMLSFLQNHWKWLVLCLAAGGFLADRLVYFLRWRPDIVWRTRRRARRAKPADFSQEYGAAIDASSRFSPVSPFIGRSLFPRTSLRRSSGAGTRPTQPPAICPEKNGAPWRTSTGSRRRPPLFRSQPRGRLKTPPGLIPSLTTIWAAGSRETRWCSPMGSGRLRRAWIRPSALLSPSP